MTTPLRNNNVFLKALLQVPWIAILLIFSTACGMGGKSALSDQPGENVAEQPNLNSNNNTPEITTTCTAQFEVQTSAPVSYYRTAPELPPSAWYVGSDTATLKFIAGDCTPGQETFQYRFYAAGQLNNSGLPELGIVFGEANVFGTLTASNFEVVGSETFNGLLDHFTFRINSLCEGRGTFLVDYRQNLLKATGALYLTFKVAEARAQGITTGIRENCQLWQ